MQNYSDDTYGERVAHTYDELYTNVDDGAIDMLSELADGGRALELGIGTGRIALPLSARNVNVSGIDASGSMVAQLKAKAGSEKINVHIGSFADVDVEGQFQLVYVVFNTFFALLTQEEQVRCFRNVAAHLTSSGCFLLEVFVPDLNRFTGNQVNWTTKINDDAVEFDTGLHDAVNQRVSTQKVVLKNDSVRLYPLQIRYVWPSELDLMGQLAGLHLRKRWSSWQRTPFDSTSGKHISIYSL